MKMIIVLYNIIKKKIKTEIKIINPFFVNENLLHQNQKIVVFKLRIHIKLVKTNWAIIIVENYRLIMEQNA